MTPIEWTLIALAAAVISLGGWLYSLRSQVFIVVVPTVMTIHVGETASLIAKLFYKPWFTTRPKPTQGTVNVHAVSPSIASVSPSSQPVRRIRPLPRSLSQEVLWVVQLSSTLMVPPDTVATIKSTCQLQ